MFRVIYLKYPVQLADSLSLFQRNNSYWVLFIFVFNFFSYVLCCTQKKTPQVVATCLGECIDALILFAQLRVYDSQNAGEKKSFRGEKPEYLCTRKLFKSSLINVWCIVKISEFGLRGNESHEFLRTHKVIEWSGFIFALQNKLRKMF